MHGAGVPVAPAQMRLAGHWLHVPAPASLYLPPGHTAAVALVEPAAQTYPALQLPEHVAFLKPTDPPYTPAGHRLHDPAPPALYWPTAHMAAVALVLPATHAYPALQLPEHVAFLRPTDPPYTPAGHRLHDPAPASLYWPTGHTAAVALVLPATQKCPAAHAPSHSDDDSPPIDPKRPAEHKPLQLATDSPLLLPNKPALQLVHDPAPPTLYWPTGHTAAVALVLPATHAYPALQLPEHVALVRPTALPVQQEVNHVHHSQA
jgi:hypothetical protein